MSVLFIAGSPTVVSRSSSLLKKISEKITGQGFTFDQLSIRDINSQALIHADFNHPDIVNVVERVACARIVVIATPIYKAAYSGLLKILLDLLPQSAFRGKKVLPLATSGSPYHMLALDYALRPVLQALGATHVLPSIYATDAEIQLQDDGNALLSEALHKRIDEAMEILFPEENSVSTELEHAM